LGVVAPVAPPVLMPFLPVVPAGGGGGAGAPVPVLGADLAALIGDYAGL
jgi:hypothetical protein